MAMEATSQAENWQNPERTPKIPPLLVTVQEAAKILSISERKLFDLHKAGILMAVRVGKGSKRYRLSDLEQYASQAKPFITAKRA